MSFQRQWGLLIPVLCGHLFSLWTAALSRRFFSISADHRPDRYRLGHFPFETLKAA
jgi:hypothetical protein